MTPSPQIRIGLVLFRGKTITVASEQNDIFDQAIIVFLQMTRSQFFGILIKELGVL